MTISFKSYAAQSMCYKWLVTITNPYGTQLS